ncbi:hypothetical protein [Methylobacterium oryzihabitans]|uniref:Tetratricopeptide repeat protein n=1 Tax=Methylobacterium oryzihabitans TaxID=2499852 RepID=A0A437PEF6_9HYPH|nr:hypothetical protein [Methylobacterium oryzihabitans]RVU20666.1 hypothetical protein EOE48_04780 [Methylobacterium oryzihabitans]
MGRGAALAALAVALAATGAAADADSARRYASEGRAALARGDAAAALAAYDAALAQLGDHMAPAGTIDDTGLHLALADAKARQGDPAAAARLKARVVATRLSFPPHR